MCMRQVVLAHLFCATQETLQVKLLGISASLCKPKKSFLNGYKEM